MMKQTCFNIIVITGLLGSVILTGCKNQVDCAASSGIPPLSIDLLIKDRQNRDLLNYATPGHYDTAQISQLNNGIFMVRNNSGKVSLHFYPVQPGQITSIVKLSSTDQDTVLVSVERTQNPCTYVDRFKSLIYNGKAYIDTMKTTFKVFEIVK